MLDSLLSLIYLICDAISMIRFFRRLPQDLLKHTPVNHADHAPLSEALAMTRNFLDEFNIIQTKSMFPVRSDSLSRDITVIVRQ